MTYFKCWNEDCIYNEDTLCNCSEPINIGECYSYGCDEYSSYLNSAEYQTPYYKACKDCNTGEAVKVLSLGKAIVIKDEVFYTEIKDIERNRECGITHGRTGYYGGYQMIIDRWDLVMSKIKDLPSVESYPDGIIYEGKCYKKEGCNGKDDI